MGIGATRWAWDQRDVTPSEKLALLALAERADNFHDCDWLGHKNLAGKTDLSVRTLNRALHGLVNRHLIQFREDERGKFCHLYVTDGSAILSDGSAILSDEQICQCGTLISHSVTDFCHHDRSLSAHINGTHAHAEKDLPEKEVSKNHQNGFSHPIASDGADLQRELKLSIQQANGTAEKLTPVDLMEGWNHVCAPAGMPAVKELSFERRRNAARRITEHPKQDWWQTVFDNLARSTFARGLGQPKPGAERSWRATFDWLLANSTNPVKAYEGRYNA